jgi:hypothetical protein
MILPAVCWTDPGDMTGIALLHDHGRQFWCDELPFFEACETIEQLARTWGRAIAIGWERYTPRPDKPQTNAHDAMGFIGVARWQARKHRCVMLDPGQARSPSKAERLDLQAIGWWRPGKNDAQSAAAHMLRYLRGSRQLPPRERAILSPGVRTMGAE